MILMTGATGNNGTEIIRRLAGSAARVRRARVIFGLRPARELDCSGHRSHQGRILVEHWDVIQDEATKEQSKSGQPMFGDKFPT
jgi:NADP-dependent 3-hydroxy acid dehydrogenase YdfG